MTKRQREAMRHPNVLGAGAAKRRKLPPGERGEVVMEEFRRGTLHSGSGQIVKDPAQARAIAFSEDHPEKRDRGRSRHYKR